jgi:hypothetical protein
MERFARLTTSQPRGREVTTTASLDLQDPGFLVELTSYRQGFATPGMEQECDTAPDAGAASLRSVVN